MRSILLDEAVTPVMPECNDEEDGVDMTEVGGGGGGGGGGGPIIPPECPD